MIRMKVGVTRKEATGRDGSAGATCEIEVEIPGGTPDDELLRIRDHWLEFCESAVDEQLDRHRDRVSAPPQPPPQPAPRAPAPSHRESRRYDDPPPPPRGRRDAEDSPADDRAAPADGRQLLGWAAKQDPDAKGLVIAFGKKQGYPPKIVDWDDDQVRSAYRYARGRQSRR